MDRLLYLAMSGAKQTQLSATVNTHNLANVTTPGFRSDFAEFMPQPVLGPGYPSRIYTSTQGQGTNFSSGTMITTGRDLDVAINGSGWLVVQGADGQEAYTRAGNLRITAEGQVQTGNGWPLLGNGGPISLPPYERIEIGSDGTISIHPTGQSAATLSVIDRIKLVNPDAQQLRKGADGLVRMADGSVQAADAAVKINHGVLESSNTNAITAMVRMIELSRQYETQVKMMRQAEQLDQAAAQLLRSG